MKQTLLFTVLIIIFAACGSGDTPDVQSGSGSLQVLAQWPEKQATYSVSTAPPGVSIVRVILSGPDMADMQADFPAVDNSGTIKGVPAGTNRIVTIQGLDGSGRLTHAGSEINVTVEAGKTNRVGPIELKVAAEAVWDGSIWNQAFWGQ